MGNNTTMKLNYIPINLKKDPYRFALLLLTVGASLILGFLSFSGMYALLPFLPFAFATFTLTVVYEGEIILQNIKGALNKLFKSNYLQNHLAKEFLLGHFPEHTNDEDCPQFFRDYKAQLKLLREFGHKELNKKSKTSKRKIEKTLKDMEQWFALQLFPTESKDVREHSKYSNELRRWLAYNHQHESQELLKKRQTQFKFVKGFSILAGLFMGLGSTYLIVEAFMVIPFFAAISFTFWPALILPMAIIAGAAYGLLTYNAITDIINNNTVVKWYLKIRHDLSQGLTVRNVFMATTAVFLVGLAVALTICTAGTWWTVATNARPLFEWMKKMPGFIMGVINPIITGLSAIFFNIENTSESLEMIDQALQSKKNLFQHIYDAIAKGWNHLRTTENWLQIFNPFRIILQLTVTPLRILFFLGHLLSIALTADRMPGIPQIVSALIAIISEGFEDAHYFVGHNHDDDEEHHHDLHSMLSERMDTASGHSHNTDIPTWILKLIASPLYALAALWDSLASNLNKSTSMPLHYEQKQQPQVLSFQKAWNKQRGVTEEEQVTIKETAKRPSKEWQIEHAVAQIEKHQRKHLNNAIAGRDLAKHKVNALNQLKNEIRNEDQHSSLAETLNQAKNNSTYNQHRLFSQANAKTNTQEFIEALPNRCGN